MKFINKNILPLAINLTSFGCSSNPNLVRSDDLAKTVCSIQRNLTLVINGSTGPENDDNIDTFISSNLEKVRTVGSFRGEPNFRMSSTRYLEISHHSNSDIFDDLMVAENLDSLSEMAQCFKSLRKVNLYITGESFKEADILKFKHLDRVYTFEEVVSSLSFLNRVNEVNVLTDLEHGDDLIDLFDFRSGFQIAVKPSFLTNVMNGLRDQINQYDLNNDEVVDLVEVAAHLFQANDTWFKSVIDSRNEISSLSIKTYNFDFYLYVYKDNCSSCDAERSALAVYGFLHPEFKYYSISESKFKQSGFKFLQGSKRTQSYFLSYNKTRKSMVDLGSSLTLTSIAEK